MLFFLTGEIQTGKTRWLQATIAELEQHGVQVQGVIAPGVWREHRNPDDDNVSYEKLGIDNVLLPSGKRITFARRVDLVDSADWENECAQAKAAGLAWAIRDEAIAEVDAFFAHMNETRSCSTARQASPALRLVVIDEFGRLELLRNEGLVSAVELIDRGATPAFPHALVIVREQLLDCARERFAHAPWNGMRPLHANDEGRNALFEAFGIF